jgi:hypothetical protein
LDDYNEKCFNGCKKKLGKNLIGNIFGKRYFSGAEIKTKLVKMMEFCAQDLFGSTKAIWNV